jgi:hypothetical protein
MFATWVLTVGRAMPSWLPMPASVWYVVRSARTRVSAGVRDTVVRDVFFLGGVGWLVMVLPRYGAAGRLVIGHFG